MSWTQDILAEIEGNGLAARSVKPAGKRIRKAARPEPVGPDPPEAALDFLDFGSRLMSLSELAEASGVGQKILRGMVRSGRLRPIKVPGAGRHRYSPRQLAQIICEYNRI